MPLVEFVCPACGESREELVRSTAGAVPPACPVCGAAMKRALSAFATPGAAGAGAAGGGCGHGSHGGFS